jgi:hypothetical protein
MKFDDSFKIDAFRFRTWLALMVVSSRGAVWTNRKSVTRRSVNVKAQT